MPLILPSLYDRLTDNTPDTEWEVIEMLEEKVKRDLERLLNTRTMSMNKQNKSEHPEVASSVINYGIDDYAGLVRNDLNLRNVTQIIKDAILTYEPRIIPQTLEVIPDIERNMEDRVFSDLPKEYKQKILSKGAFEFIIRGTICANEIPVDFHTKINIADGRLQIN